jgi:hypothetical protein
VSILGNNGPPDSSLDRPQVKNVIPVRESRFGKLQNDLSSVSNSEVRHIAYTRKRANRMV